MRITAPATQRRGATLVEGALILPVFLLIILGMIDLALGISQSQMLSTAARQGARQAIVHGDLASREMGKWGPGTYGPVAATDSDPIAEAIRPYLGTVDPAEVTITVEWPDGGTAAEQRVRVTLAHSYRPITTLLFQGAIPLGASSTMRIAH